MDLKKEIKKIILYVLMGCAGRVIIDSFGISKNLMITLLIISPAIFTMLGVIYRITKNYDKCLKYNVIALSCCIATYSYLLFAIIPLIAVICIVIESLLKKSKVYN